MKIEKKTHNSSSNFLDNERETKSIGKVFEQFDGKTKGEARRSSATRFVILTNWTWCAWSTTKNDCNKCASIKLRKNVIHGFRLGILARISSNFNFIECKNDREKQQFYCLYKCKFRNGVLSFYPSIYSVAIQFG